MHVESQLSILREGVPMKAGGILYAGKSAFNDIQMLSVP
jgi:hypothetical protein